MAALTAVSVRIVVVVLIHSLSDASEEVLRLEESLGDLAPFRQPIAMVFPTLLDLLPCKVGIIPAQDGFDRVLVIVIVADVDGFPADLSEEAADGGILTNPVRQVLAEVLVVAVALSPVGLGRMTVLIVIVRVIGVVDVVRPVVLIITAVVIVAAIVVAAVVIGLII